MEKKYPLNMRRLSWALRRPSIALLRDNLSSRRLQSSKQCTLRYLTANLSVLVSAVFQLSHQLFMPNVLPIFLVAALAASLIGCASQRISSNDPVNRALQICGNGINAKSGDAFRVAIDSAEKKGISFETEASQAVDTQIGILLKQADLKSDANIRAVAEEMKATRECVIKQVEAARPPTKAELLEQCRLDAQRRLSPPGPTGYGVVRFWSQAKPDQASGDIVAMKGLFDTGGSSSIRILVRCDLTGSRFNEAVLQADE